MQHDPYEHIRTFSDVHGLRNAPELPRLKDISTQARNNLWSALWRHMRATAIHGAYRLGEPWRTVLATVHQRMMGYSLDDFDDRLWVWQQRCKPMLRSRPYNQCFDLLETLMRHPECPRSFVEETKEIFRHQLAYRVDTTSIPTVVPASTEDEGGAVTGAFEDLAGAGLSGAVDHLRQASERIRDEDWPGSVRASIDAVECVATQLVPGEHGTLAMALKSLKGQKPLHPALKRGFIALYSYAADEPEARHVLLKDKYKATEHEAIFMIGACAAFCSYMLRKFDSGDDASSTKPHR